jgi:hypothetical protein
MPCIFETLCILVVAVTAAAVVVVVVVVATAVVVVVVVQERILSAVMKIVGAMATLLLYVLQACSMNPVMYVNIPSGFNTR